MPTHHSLRKSLGTVLWFLILLFAQLSHADDDHTLRVFIFAGQSNMVGSDSHVTDIQRFPPFRGVEKQQKEIPFSYCIGREEKRQSDGWELLRPIGGIVGPELTFAKKVRERTGARIAIIKVAAGGTHLGGDWNPDEPSGFKMYPLALKWVRTALKQLDDEGIAYRLEGFVWHQGENDTFEEEYRKAYGRNLKNFLACWRRDLHAPDLPFWIGELCTKTIWGMDCRAIMYAIHEGQIEVTKEDSNATYVPTAHVGVEIGDEVGLHYHYGTLGQLEHGINYAGAYLRSIGKSATTARPLKKWPLLKEDPIQLFILAGHRNMEGERAFRSELRSLKGGRALEKDDHATPYRYEIGGGAKASDGWEPLGPAGLYENFGPELSFGRTLDKKLKKPFAIAKFTHSGSQIIDWTPEGSMASSRHLYPRFIEFVRESVRSLEEKGHEVQIAGIFYHLGENDMSFGPYRQEAVNRLASLIEQSRVDLKQPTLRWFVSQQPPTDHERLNEIDVVGAMRTLAKEDPHLQWIPVFDLPGREQRIVITTPGIVELGVRLAEAYLHELKQRPGKKSPR